MDLKALAAALTMAFLVVIIDAVFGFHYVYVLVMVTALSYVFVRLRTRKQNSADRATMFPSWITLLGSSDLDDESRQALSADLPGPVTPAGPRKASAILADQLNRRLSKPLVLKTDVSIPVPPAPFLDYLGSMIEAMDIRSELRIRQVKTVPGEFTIMTIQANRKLSIEENPMKPSFDRLKLHMETVGGTAWITHPPRKTAIHVAIPGS